MNEPSDPSPPPATTTGLDPGAYVDDLKQALLDRLDDLQTTIDDLIGQQVGGDQRDRDASDEVAAAPELLNVDQATYELLQELRGFPDEMRRRMERHLERSGRRPRAAARHLRRLSVVVVDATARIEEWFAPHSGLGISPVLTEAVRQGLLEVGLVNQRAIVTSGPSNRLETGLADARAQIFVEPHASARATKEIDEPGESKEPEEPDTAEPDTAEPDTAEPDTAEPDTAEPDTAEPDTAEPDTAEPDTAEPDTAEPDTAEPDTAEPDTAEPDESDSVKYAVFKIPAHEAKSPRWWPVVLGHEIAHHRLRADERLALTAREATIPEHSEIGNSHDAFYVLRLVGIESEFPVDEMRAAIEAEATRSRPPLQPPEIGSPDERGRSAPDTSTLASRIRIANSWAEEILCDLAMVRRFGPAAIPAMANYLIAVANYEVRSITHPPGWFRVNQMIDYLGPDVEERFAPIYQNWSSAGAAKDPPAPQWMTVLLSYLSDHRSKLHRAADGWNGPAYDATSPLRGDAVSLAARQLSYGLPPFSAVAQNFPPWPSPPPDQATGSSTAGVGDQPSTAPDGDGTDWLVEIGDADLVNAAWLSATLRHRGVEPVHRSVPIDRLVLKSIETLQLLNRVGRRPDEEAIEASALPSPLLVDPFPPATPGGPTGAILGAAAIKDRLRDPDPWRRIEVTPNLNSDIADSSIDLRLGTRFIVFQRSAIASFNVMRGHNARAVQRLVERPLTSSFILHPGELVLAAAMEYISMPSDLGAQVITRSSYGRLGLITATAVQVHPLYRGCLTLELVNLGSVPMTLYPGEPVAQLVFMQVQTPDDGQPPSPDLVFRRKYVCPTGPEFPRVAPDPVIARLREGP